MVIGKKIKRSFSRFLKGEQGQVLPLVLILLVLGSTIMAGTLTYASTSLKTSQIDKAKAEQLCAADAGVRWAIWKLTNDFLSVPQVASTGLDYTDADFADFADLNNKNVTVNIYCVTNVEYNRIYRITSTAVGTDSSTTVEAYVTKMFELWKNAATSQAVTLKPGAVVYGPIDIITPAEANKWPFVESAIKPYLKLQGIPALGTLAPYASGDWWVDEPGKNIIGPLLAQPPLQGGKYHLDINNKGGAAITATLGAAPPLPWATIYVEQVQPSKTELNIGYNSVSEVILELNRNTIFVDGSIALGGKCTIKGSGCIIATGDVLFKPNIVSTPDDFVFVMSLNGAVTFEPGGDFYGSIAGKNLIYLAPNNILTKTTPPKDGLNFPTTGLDSSMVWSIRSWQINRTTGIVAGALTIITPSLSPGEVGIAYSQTLAAAGGIPPYDWSVTAGSLPVGVPAFTLDSSTGVISGTPTVAGNYNFTVQVEDAALATATKLLTIDIYPAVDIPNQMLHEGEVSLLYSDTPNVNPGVPPYTPWSQPGAGSLPNGLTQNTATGEISGTPTAAGTYNFSIGVVDMNGLGGTDIQPLSITIYDQVKISNILLSDGKKNKAYGAVTGQPNTPQFIVPAFGKAPYSNWLMSGNPPNLSLNPLTGQLTGNLKAADVGTWNITFSVMDSLGVTSPTKTLTLIVNN
jgi:hypothetical protein